MRTLQVQPLRVAVAGAVLSLFWVGAARSDEPTEGEKPAKVTY